MAKTHDVIVIGGGPAGAAAARTLAMAGVDCAILDRAQFPRDKTCGDALTPRAVMALRDMGLLEEVRALGNDIAGVRVVGPRGGTAASKIPAIAGLPTPALVVPRRALDAAILARAERSGAVFTGGVTVDRLETEADGVTIRGHRDGRPFAARGRAAIVATGAAYALHLRAGWLRRPPPLMRAARAYFEGLRDLGDVIHCRFDGVPLPGYGWIFPTSATTANVGAGFFADGWRARRRPATIRDVYDGFVAAPPLRALLDGGRRVGAVNGYPLRADFPRAPVRADRVLMAGEAAGLVNPLTGEGIDYALESGRIAGEHLAAALRRDVLGREALRPYEEALRARYQNLFSFCARMRAWCVNRIVMDRLVATAARRPELNAALVNLVLGNRPTARALTLRNVVRAALMR